MRFIFTICAVMLAAALPIFATTEAGPLLVTVTTSPNPYAIRGNTSVAQSVGVLGYGTGATDVGLEGYATQPGSVGLEGFAASTTGTPSNGVFGYSADGYGVYGVSAAANDAGVYGVSSVTNGVIGQTSDTTSDDNYGSSDGVEGIDASDSNETFGNSGVVGTATNGVGVGAFSKKNDALYAVGNEALYAASGTGPSIEVSNESNGIESDATIELDNASTTSGALMIEADATQGIGYAMSLDTSGNMILAGTLKQKGSPQSTVRDSSGVDRIAYSQRATQSTLEDFGQGKLVAGRAFVPLDPAYASTLANSNYLVFLTPEGPSNVLFVTNKSASGFEVRETSGAASLTFDYRIVGTPRAERPEPRLAPFSVPKISPARLAAMRAKRIGALAPGGPATRTVGPASRSRYDAVRVSAKGVSFPVGHTRA